MGYAIAVGAGVVIGVVIALYLVHLASQSFSPFR